MGCYNIMWRGFILFLFLTKVGEITYFFLKHIEWYKKILYRKSFYDASHCLYPNLDSYLCIFYFKLLAFRYPILRYTPAQCPCNIGWKKAGENGTIVVRHEDKVGCEAMLSARALMPHWLPYLHFLWWKKTLRDAALLPSVLVSVLPVKEGNEIYHGDFSNS